MTSRGPVRQASLARVLRLLARIGLIVTVAVAAVPLAAEQPAGDAARAEALPFRPEPPLRSYVAIRRLESENARHNKEAWLVARTELRDDGTFHYEILEEGGSEFILRKVLREALEKEQQVHKDGKARRSSLTHDNYEFTAPTESNGSVRVGLVPRRNDDMLVKGTLVTAPDGEILRIEGDLVKRPSLWTKAVRVVREYDRVAGAHVPVRLDTVAQVRFAGTSTMRVTYEYLAINGRPVHGPALNLAGATVTSRGAAARQ